MPMGMLRPPLFLWSFPMATKVDICNLALAVLGDTATVSSIDPPEGSAQADPGARLYSMSVNEVLSQHPWSFALKRAKLAEMTTNVQGEGSARYYACPPDCLRVHRLYGEGFDSRYFHYSIETINGQRVIVTDAPSPWIKYVSSQVSESMFPPLFTTCVVHRLAAWLSGPLVVSPQSTEMARKQVELYAQFLSRAIHADASQQHKKEQSYSRFLEDYSGVMPDEFH